MTKFFRKITYPKLLAGTFALIILIGALLLCLPISSRSGEATPFVTSLFTATSATCVTGLVVVDTGTYWSLFGQVVILFLIQIGGLGFMTFFCVFSTFTKRRIGLAERKVLMQSSGSTRLSGVVTLTRRIFLGTAIFEILGAIILSLKMIPRFGVGKGIYYSIFHSISAFCNAGFDVFGGGKSFTEYVSSPTVNLTLCALILIGGIGFFVWNDIRENGFHFKKYSLHSKIVLTSTFILVLVSWIFFYLIERNHALDGLNEGQKILASLFGAISPRTAGFNTIDLSKMSDSGVLLNNILMLIGGNSGSTAGGIKLNTVVVLILTLVSAIKQRDSIIVFKKELDTSTIKQACAVFVLYISVALVAIMTLCIIEPYGMREISFEVSSAIATVGLTLGITSSLTIFSQVIIIALMFFGRLGGLALIQFVVVKSAHVPIKKPVDKILIG